MTASPEYEAKRAVRITRRQEKEAKRRFDFLAGQIRSQLRRQLDQILKQNTPAFIMLLANGGALKLGVEAVEKAPEPIIDAPVIDEADRTPPSAEDPVPLPPPLLVPT